MGPYCHHFTNAETRTSREEVICHGFPRAGFHETLPLQPSSKCLTSARQCQQELKEHPSTPFLRSSSGPLFPLPSRDRAVGDSPDGPHPAPMAEPDRELGALVGGWEARAAPGPGFELQAPGPEGSRLGGARDRICLKGVGFGGLLLSGRYC